MYNKTKDAINVKRVNASSIPFAKYIDAAKIVCSKIKSVYEPAEIIMHVHKIVDEYTDGNKILRFNNEKFPARKKAVQEVMNKMYNILRKELEGCHVIEFPDYVLGDSKHKFGVCGLHYHKLYLMQQKHLLFGKVTVIIIPSIWNHIRGEN